MSTRFDLLDRPRVDITVDPQWLLAPLFCHATCSGPIAGPSPVPALLATDQAAVAELRTAGTARSDPAVSAADWAQWWQAAIDWEPVGPPVRQPELVAFSPALQQLWSAVEPSFERWVAIRSGTRRGGEREAAVLDGLDDAMPVIVRVLLVPVAGELALRAGSDRLVVSPAGRQSDRYRRLLTGCFTGR